MNQTVRQPIRIAASACPHDCPSTCALEVEVLDSEADQFASPQRTRESQEKQRAVAKAGESVGLSLDHGLEVGDDRRSLAKLAGAVGALDAGERFPDRGGASV